MTVDTKRNYDYPSFNLCVAAALLTISMHGTVSAQDQGTAPRRTAPYIPQRPSTAFQEIARGKPATQQSTEGLPFGRPASEAKMYQASLAVDGKIETFSQTQKGVYINRGLGSTNDGVAD